MEFKKMPFDLLVSERHRRKMEMLDVRHEVERLNKLYKQMQADSSADQGELENLNLLIGKMKKERLRANESFKRIDHWFDVKMKQRVYKSATSRKATTSFTFPSHLIEKEMNKLIFEYERVVHLKYGGNSASKHNFYNQQFEAEKQEDLKKIYRHIEIFRVALEWLEFNDI